ncbi:MAG: Uncharacterised protein [Flavobacteriia bacterium]|nr:MAG: Uncharacterised protein [Flavobacteriia bacterium]
MVRKELIVVRPAIGQKIIDSDGQSAGGWIRKKGEQLIADEDVVQMRRPGRVRPIIIGALRQGMIGKSVARGIGNEHAKHIVLEGIHQVIVQIAKHNETVTGMIQQQVLFEQVVGFHSSVFLVAGIVGIELSVTAAFVVVVDGHPIRTGKLEFDDQG